jgi:extracellular factor (EF) 3-hydroxypalmitic acid methyl ester biosynthesis protein
VLGLRYRHEHDMPQIDPAFATFVDGFAGELDVLQKFFTTSPEEPSNDELLSGLLFSRFSPWLDQRLLQLRELAQRLGPEAAEHHGAYFREHMRRFTEQSEFLKRTNDRPRGYAGDSALMQMLYDRDFRGASIFGRLLHRHPIESAAAHSVRARLPFIAGLVRSRLARDPRGLRVLSVACGPARELRHCIVSAEDARRTEFVFVDQDDEALREAKLEIRQLEQCLGVRLRARCERAGVGELLSTLGFAETRLGTFDLIYSMGLFDYLAQPVAKKLAEKLASMTNPGGVNVIGNFHVSTKTRCYLDYWMDWPLIYRTEHDMLCLAQDIRAGCARVVYEPSHSQMFLVVERLADEAA